MSSDFARNFLAMFNALGEQEPYENMDLSPLRAPSPANKVVNGIAGPMEVERAALSHWEQKPTMPSQPVWHDSTSPSRRSGLLSALGQLSAKRSAYGLLLNSPQRNFSDIPTLSSNARPEKSISNQPPDAGDIHYERTLADIERYTAEGVLMPEDGKILSDRLHSKRDQEQAQHDRTLKGYVSKSQDDQPIALSSGEDPSDSLFGKMAYLERHKQPVKPDIPQADLSLLHLQPHNSGPWGLQAITPPVSKLWQEGERLVNNLQSTTAEAIFGELQFQGSPLSMIDKYMDLYRESHTPTDPNYFQESPNRVFSQRSFESPKQTDDLSGWHYAWHGMTKQGKDFKTDINNLDLTPNRQEIKQRFMDTPEMQKALFDLKKTGRPQSVLMPTVILPMDGEQAVSVGKVKLQAAGTLFLDKNGNPRFEGELTQGKNAEVWTFPKGNRNWQLELPTRVFRLNPASTMFRTFFEGSRPIDTNF